MEFKQFNPSDENIDKLRDIMIQNEEYEVLCSCVSRMLETTKNIRQMNSQGLKYTIQENMKAENIKNDINIDKLFVCLYDTFIDLKYRPQSVSKRNPSVNYFFNIAIQKPYKVLK